VGACVAPLAGAGAQTDLPAWGVDPSPNGGFGRNAFAAVDALSPTDAWAVGAYEEGLLKRPLVQRGNGTAWTIVETPPIEGELLGVAAVAPDDVWMVGGYESGGEALIMHWDGRSVSVVPHPNPGSFNRLHAVAAISATDVWAVGVTSTGISRTFALHWDGSAWTQVPIPTGSQGHNTLYGVAAVSSRDVWAVGDDGNHTISLHWDGESWRRVSTPSPGSHAVLRAVSGTAPGNVWAVGDGSEGSLTMRWNGRRWNVVASPDPGSLFLDVNGVNALSESDVWAVGVYAVQGNWKTLAMHWDGASWNVVASPSPDPVINVLNGLVAQSATDVLAVGAGGGTGTLALRLRGTAWSRTPSENGGVGENVLNGISAASPADIWAVGHAQQRSLTLHNEGAGWSIVPSPNLEFGVRLEDVVALGPEDAWAVGWSGTAGSFDRTNVAMHWDGEEWSIVPTPQPGGAFVDQLLAIDAVGPNNIWAVGSYQIDQAFYRSLVLHWDGRTWSLVPNTCDTRDRLSGLTGITVLSSSNVWALGDSTFCHYDGSSWTEVPSPQPRPEHYEIAYQLEDLSAVAPDDIWAVGARVTKVFEHPQHQAFAEHWDGQQWVRVVAMPGTFLYGVEAISADDVWAVGTDSFGPMIVHFDGAQWSVAPTPEAGRGGQLRGSEPVGESALWAAGNYLPTNAGHRTLILNAPSDREGAVVGATNVSDATISWFGAEDGSTETNDLGHYQVGGLLAGTYLFTATYQGCLPDSAQVTVVAGQTVRQDLHLEC
jgi:hypothetical protein